MVAILSCQSYCFHRKKPKYGTMIATVNRANSHFEEGAAAPRESPIPLHSTMLPPPSIGVTVNLASECSCSNAIAVFVCNETGPARTRDVPFANPINTINWSIRYLQQEGRCNGHTQRR
jgi:hypothetical protein